MEALQVSLGMIPKPDAAAQAGAGRKRQKTRAAEIGLPPVRLLLFYGCV